MNKTTFLIAGMDCPSEEQMIRLRLADLTCVRSLNFNLSQRTLTVWHEGHAGEIARRLECLDLKTSLLDTVRTDIAEQGAAESQELERRLLWQVLAINLFFFLLELLTGFLAGSMGLLADSLDMLADSLVYGMALAAVGSTALRKTQIARASGYFQLILACAGLAEVVRRFIDQLAAPDPGMMVLISLLALLGNAVCLFLLQKSRSQGVHMQASVIFTSNDVIANLGVIVAGSLVYLTASKLPDLAVGAVVFAMVSRGAWRILKLASQR